MVLSFWSIADDERAKCTTMLNNVRTALSRAVQPDFGSGVRVPGGTGVTVWAGREMCVDRSRRAFMAYVESLSAKYQCADIDWRSFSP